MTIEQKAGETILQGAESIEINGQKYEVGKPSVATLIMISELVSTLPEYDVNNNNVLGEVLANAKESKVLGQIGATLILGAKRVKEKRVVEKISFFDKVLRRRACARTETDVLAEEILDNMSAQELSILLTSKLTSLDIGSFFVLTTSLMTTNVLKPTKESTSEVGATKD